MAQPYFTRKAHFTNPKGIDFTEKKHRLSLTNGASLLVELRGSEPLSENNLTGLSSGVVCYLHSRTGA